MRNSKANHYEVRLAQSDVEVKAAQALRYRVFYDEMGAIPSNEISKKKLDIDPYDAFCDHLLVINREKSNGQPCVVGTYRLLRKSVATENLGFYSQQEYDLSSLMSFSGEILEVGRSCVDSSERTGAVIQLLWGGIARYITQHEIQLLFGCASFKGIEQPVLMNSLSYLYHNHLAPKTLRPRALDNLYIDMSKRPNSEAERMNAVKSLPPLIKGYLRVGGYVGDGAVVDHQFNTTDICVVLKTDQVTQRYRRHYQSSLATA